MMDGRLIAAARLQVAGSDQLHVERFGWRANHLLLRTSKTSACQEVNREKGCELEATAHLPPPTVQGQSALAANTITQAVGSAQHTLLTCNRLVAYYPGHG